MDLNQSSYLDQIEQMRQESAEFREQEKKNLGEMELGLGSPLSAQLIKSGLTNEAKTFLKNKLVSRLPEEVQGDAENMLDDLGEGGENFVGNGVSMARNTLRGGFRSFSETLNNWTNSLRQRISNAPQRFRQSITGSSSEQQFDNPLYSNGDDLFDSSPVSSGLRGALDTDPELPSVDSAVGQQASRTLSSTVVRTGENAGEEFSEGLTEGLSDVAPLEEIAGELDTVPGLDLLTGAIGVAGLGASVGMGLKNIFEHHSRPKPNLTQTSYQAPF